MTRFGKRLIIIVGAAAATLLGLFVLLSLFFFAGQSSSNINKFQPTLIDGRADSAFFYSVGDSLKYSDHIDAQAPTLLRGTIKNFLVSPDNARIAVVADGELVIVKKDSTLIKVAPVDSIYREPKPIGNPFFRDNNFQWSEDSNTLYLIRDEYYASQGSQLYSNKGELWKYDLRSHQLLMVLKPFQAFSYFFGRGSGIYFSVPTDRGDLRLRYFNGKAVKDAGDVNAWDISRDKLSPGLTESPFYSFSITDYQEAVLPSKGVRLVSPQGEGLQELVIQGKSYVALTQGKTSKGPYYCSETLRSVFLPGERYFLFNTPYCGNYNGQLLIDTSTGKYQRLPADSVVYLTLNTETYPYYRVTGGGIIIQ